MLATVQEWLDEAGVGRIGSRRRPLLRDGPRHALGPHGEGASSCCMEGEAEHEAESRRGGRQGAYERDETDEFITATKVGDEDATIRPGDSVLAFNFRPDRMRQITEALDQGGRRPLRDADRVRGGLAVPGRVPARAARRDAGEASSPSRGETQLHVAETEKYPHVTYFFNGGEEEPYEGEVRELVDSPRDVPTYDHKPEMSAREAADAFVAPLGRGRRRVFGIINFANAGHGRPHRRRSRRR